MNCQIKRSVATCIGVVSVFASLNLYSAETVEVIYENNFEAGVVPSGPDLYFKAESGATMSVSANKSLNYNGSVGSLRGAYPIAAGDGGYYLYATVGMPRKDISELFIEFKAKIPGNKQGSKFLKIFGQYSSSTGYANTTFGLDYTSGDMNAVSFGSGDLDGRAQLANDTHNVILFNGDYPTWIGRSVNVAKVSTPQKKAWRASDWGDGWHHFRFHLKFNTGTSVQTERADGKYYVEIDGKVYVDAKEVFNRHHLNGPIDRIELFGWSQNGTKTFEIWYDDLRITTGNFLDNPIGTAPMPPSTVSMQAR